MDLVVKKFENLFLVGFQKLKTLSIKKKKQTLKRLVLNLRHIYFILNIFNFKFLSHMVTSCIEVLRNYMLKLGGDVKNINRNKIHAKSWTLFLLNHIPTVSSSKTNDKIYSQLSRQ